MAVTIATAKDGRRLDNIILTISGTLNDTVASTDLSVITPSDEVIAVDLSPENFTVPATLPISRSISASLLGLTTYGDGVYSFTYTVNYDDLTTETASASVFLFDNNATAAWFDLIERHLILNSSCSDEETKKRQEGKEMIEAAREAFSLVRYDDAEKLIGGSLEIFNSCS